MEWEGPGIVLATRPFGEGDAVATIMTEAQGRHLGLARGAASRAQAGLWQPGNLLQFRWVGRLAEQLGSLSGEMVHPTAALALDDGLALAILSSACAVADGALPEREPMAAVFRGLLGVVARLAEPRAVLADLVRWEASLLAGLGYGLSLAACAVSGVGEDLAYVSPRTGRALSRAAAVGWEARLLGLPGFLAGEGAAGIAAVAAGLRLTGHFLARDAFGAQNRALPAARLALYDRVCALERAEADG